MGKTPDRNIAASRAISVTEDALEAFWRVVAKKYPQAKTGDLSPGTHHALQRAAQAAVAEWVEANVPATHHATMKSGVKKSPSQLNREIAATLVPHSAKGDRVLADLKGWGIDREQLAEVREAFNTGDHRRAMALARDLGWNRSSKRGRAFR